MVSVVQIHPFILVPSPYWTCQSNILIFISIMQHLQLSLVSPFFWLIWDNFSSNGLSYDNKSSHSIRDISSYTLNEIFLVHLDSSFQTYLVLLETYLVLPEHLNQILMNFLIELSKLTVHQFFRQIFKFSFKFSIE